MSSGGYFSEVAEANATGMVAEIYQDIRSVMGVSVVNLVYRHLAVCPPVLEAVWTSVRPRFADPSVIMRIGRTVRARPLGLSPWRASTKALLGVDEAWERGLRDTVALYNYANALNLTMVEWALESGSADAPGEDVAQAPPMVLDPGKLMLLPMRRLDGLDPTMLDIMDEIATTLGPDREVTVVPSLFRHFVDRPAYLAAAWAVIRVLVVGDRFEAERIRLRRAAGTILSDVPSLRLGPSDRDFLREISGFRYLVPSMLFVGGALAEMCG